ncbi:Uncharacterized protein HZ326_9237 [Fusarium oxysporum f. sp. albedinis]|nr:Uncharacterized protein HZ326_9237 [Fusarium oxysporum f. sp. albedinis]
MTTEGLGSSGSEGLQDERLSCLVPRQAAELMEAAWGVCGKSCASGAPLEPLRADQDLSMQLSLSQFSSAKTPPTFVSSPWRDLVSQRMVFSQSLHFARLLMLCE